MADIIDEVIRDKKEETKVLYFRKSLPFVLGITILVVLGMIINDFRRSSAKAHNEEVGDTIVNSLENLANDPDVAFEGLKYVQDNAKNHAKDVAILQEIAIKMASKKLDDAVNLLEDVIENKKFQDLTRSYARLTWISIMMDKKSIPDETKSKIKKYFGDFKEQSPYWASAKLLEALYFAGSDKAKANSIAESILASKNATRNVREEASALISNLKIGK